MLNTFSDKLDPLNAVKHFCSPSKTKDRHWSMCSFSEYFLFNETCTWQGDSSIADVMISISIEINSSFNANYAADWWSDINVTSTTMKTATPLTNSANVGSQRITDRFYKWTETATFLPNGLTATNVKGNENCPDAQESPTCSLRTTYSNGQD